MKLGILAGYSGRKFNIAMDAIKHAENLGYDSLWTAEAYGSDAVTPAAWILAQTERLKVGTAIMQMPRTVACHGRDDGYESGRAIRVAVYLWVWARPARR